jgi:hypothetical protein
MYALIPPGKYHSKTRPRSRYSDRFQFIKAAQSCMQAGDAPRDLKRSACLNSFPFPSVNSDPTARLMLSLAWFITHEESKCTLDLIFHSHCV